MNLEVGAVLSGKVTGIAKFGAFVSLGQNKSGLVHISEVADTYISSVEDYLSVGQEVMVKIISIDGNGRIYLSIKQAAEGYQPKTEAKHIRRQGEDRQGAQRQEHRQHEAGQESRQQFQNEPPAGKTEDRNFEDTLKKFLKEADSKISESGRYERQRSSRRRNGRR